MITDIATPGRPAIAYAGDRDGLDWDTLAALAPKIGELLGTAETANALESVVVSLARRLGASSSINPSDADYSAVFEESVERVAEVRRAHRSGVLGLAYVLRPIVAALLGEDLLESLLDATDGEPEPERIADWLEPAADRLPAGLTPWGLVALASGDASLPSLRDRLGIEYGRFNAVLQSMEGYEPIHNAPSHVVAVASYLARRRQDFAESLRAAFVQEFDRYEVPTRYNEMSAELAAAILRRATPVESWARMLDPDPAWLDSYATPPDDLIAARVNAWLQAAGQVRPEETTALPPLHDVQPANAAAVREFAHRASTLLPAWSAKRGGVPLPGWATAASSDEVVQQFASRGLLDFRPLDDAAIVAWLERLGLWPDNLPARLTLEELGLTEADIAAQREESDRLQWERSQARRSIELDGEPITLDADRLGEVIEGIRAGLTAELLRTPESPVALQELAERRRRTRKEPNWDRKPKSRVPTRMTSDQTELIGFMGELVAYEWLRKRHGESCLWRSHYRRHVIADGDIGNDDLGFDFEVLRRRGAPMMFEVKATTGDDLGFEMSEAEIAVAQDNAGNDRYRILYVAHVNDRNRRWLAVLPNPLSGSGRGHYRIVGRGIRYEFGLIDPTADPGDADG